MRLITFQHEDGHRLGLVSRDGVIDLTARTGHSSIRAVLAADALDDLRGFSHDRADLPLSSARLLPPIIDPHHFFCVGTNYLDHLTEVQAAGIARPTPKAPALFVRFPETLVGHGGPLVCPKVSSSFDFEGELAVIIGKGGRYIGTDDALGHVAGYSCFNDGSVRDWQFHTSQVTSGKNFVSTGGFGPWMVTSDEIKDPQRLRLRTRVAGETLQDGNTADMIFSVAEIVSYASALLPLQPGDVIATGTPSGVGFSRQPARFVQPGETVEVEIEQIGILNNKMISEKEIS